MVKLDKLLKELAPKILQAHMTDANFVGTVVDEATKLELEEKLATAGVAHFITVAPALQVSSEVEEAPSDKVSVLYYGMVPTSSLTNSDFGKLRNQQFFDRFLTNYKTLGYFEPLVVDKDFVVIDGAMRLLAAQELKLPKLPVIVVDASELQRRLLRLVLNKSAEFQRWHWEEVDAFLEAHMEFLPQLEPFAIFGERVLPESFFGSTIFNYEIFEETLGAKTQQSKYKQEYGLARWAEIRRQEAEAREASKQDKKKPKGPAGPDLFGGIL